MQTTDDKTATDGSVVAARQWPVVVTLKHPIEFGKERIMSLEFRRGRMGDLKGMRVDGMPPVDHLIQLASRMCGQPTQVIDRLDAEDSGEVLELAIDFFASCLGAGRTP